MSTGQPTSINYPLLQDLSVYERGRSPVLQPQPWVFPASASQSASGPPVFETPPTSGVACRDELVALVGVRLSERQDKRQAWYRVNTADAGEDYGVVFEAATPWTVDVSGVAGDPETTIDNLITALEASGDFTGAGGAAEKLGTDAVKLSFPIEPDEPLGIAAAQAQGSFAGLVCEPKQVYWRVWGLPLGRSSWVLLPGHTYVSFANELLPVSCAGYERLYIEVVYTDGAALPLIGPCLLDDRRDAQLALATQALEARYGSATGGVTSFTLPQTGDSGALEAITSAETYASLGVSSGILTEGLAAIAPTYALAAAGNVDLELFVRYRGDVTWTAPKGTDNAGVSDDTFADLYLVNGAQRIAHNVTAIASGTAIRGYRRIDWRAYLGPR